MTNDEVIACLNDLIETSKDGEFGFRECAEHVKSAELRTLFAARAAECRSGAEELQSQVAQLGGKPDQGGSIGGAAHRGWVSLRAALSKRDDAAMLDECERGEDIALARYRDASRQPLPATAKSIVDRQLQGVQRNHDQIRALRDRFRAAA